MYLWWAVCPPKSIPQVRCLVLNLAWGMSLSFRLFFKQNETTASIMGYCIMITSFLCTKASHAACICQGRSKAMVICWSVLMGSHTAGKTTNTTTTTDCLMQVINYNYCRVLLSNWKEEQNSSRICVVNVTGRTSNQIRFSWKLINHSLEGYIRLIGLHDKEEK